MSTLTPNYGLIVPEAIDNVSQVRADYATNLGIIDNISGGGGGGGNVFGAFVNTNRIITSGTYSSSLNYTATEDCCFQFNVGGTSSSSGKVYIDGNLIQSVYVTSNNDYRDFVFLRKGQIITLDSPQSGTFDYTVYGLIQGTEGIFTPVIYSDNERMIGIWRDNKPLYQKTFVLPTPVNLSISSWDNMGVSVTNGENIIICLGMATDGTCTPLMAYFNSDTLMCQSPRNGTPSYSTQYITIQYTKTTDAPGSGSWNTDGVPTVHYSTSEQVIGTWIDGKPLYQKTIYLPTVASGVSYSHSIADVEMITIFNITAKRNTGWFTSGHVFEDSPNDIAESFSIIPSPSSLFAYVYGCTVTDAYVTIRYTKTTD